MKGAFNYGICLQAFCFIQGEHVNSVGFKKNPYHTL